MRSISSRQGIRRTQGFTLIEVLIAMFILAIGILGAGAIQTVGLQSSIGAYTRSQAMFIANDIADRIRANRAVKANYAVGDVGSAAGGSVACLTSGGCSPANLATADITEIKAYFDPATGLLPGGDANISLAGNTFTIQVTWSERETQASTYIQTTQNKSYTANVDIQ